ncbi:MAG TPA: hypothetical protein PKD75_10355 [Tepidiformaceae bacterium]|jgi:hypothetical protein|nr:hypothetical protein [Tepidiformaceae bacterium]
MTGASLRATFEALRELLVPFATQLELAADDATIYSLDTPHIQSNRKPLFFGAVRQASRYVSYHLMPVYTDPDLLDGISPQLRGRMQGKSCFNLKEPDREVIDELRQLTASAFERYRDKGYLERRT